MNSKSSSEVKEVRAVVYLADGSILDVIFARDKINFIATSITSGQALIFDDATDDGTAHIVQSKEIVRVSVQPEARK